MKSPSQMRENASAAAQRICEQCGESFKPRRKWQRFCDSKCRKDFHLQADTLENRVKRLEEQVDALVAIVNP